MGKVTTPALTTTTTLVTRKDQLFVVRTYVERQVVVISCQYVTVSETPGQDFPLNVE